MALRLREHLTGDVIKASYRVNAGSQGEHVIACIWCFRPDVLTWTVVQTEPELLEIGPLDALGMRALALHFGLSSFQNILTPREVGEASPLKLVRAHWLLVNAGKVHLKHPISHDPDNQIPAVFVY